MKNKILLIDDDLLVAKTIKNLLTRQGYEVDHAPNALEAVSQVAVKDYDLVVSDIRMPGENGIIAIEKIKKIYRDKSIVCGYMLITGYTEEDTPAHAIRLGVNKFIFKPFDNEKFLAGIKEELELVQKEKELKSGKTAPQVWIKQPVPEHLAKRRRAVITGIGCVAPNGIGKEAYWKGLREGRNCVDQITFFDTATFPAKVAAEVRGFRPEEFISDHSEIKRIAKSSQFAIAASRLAVNDAKILEHEVSDAAVFVGSSMSGVEYILPEAYAFERGGITKVRPYVGIAGFLGSVSSEVSRHLHIHGPSYTISTGCTSSTEAIGFALRQIQSGYSDICLSGGADACVVDGVLAAFCRMGATSTRNDAKASRPFNKDRDGFVIADGAWIFVIEEMDRALKRNARIYAEVAGYGATCDAWHMAKPHPSGDFSALAVEQSLRDAQMQPEEIDIFEAYGNSTVINDAYETGIVKKVFGKHAYKMAMPSIKSMLGHPIGSAGAGQVAAALLALQEGFLHPTINYEVPDPDCDLDYIPNKGRQGSFRAAVCNSLAFGGKNSAIIVKKF